MFYYINTPKFYRKRGAFLDTILVFIIFSISLLFSIYKGIHILYPLLFGLICFTLISLRRGYKLKDLATMMLKGTKKSLIVVKIFVLIGAITAIWRACGTIPFIVYYGMLFMSSEYFILSAFILCAIVSTLLGSAYGTSGTIGVVLIVLAKSGNVDINVAAGAIIAGAYVGDRCSPMSSSANLVAAITDTKVFVNIKNMLTTSTIPFILSILAYAYISPANPLVFQGNEISNEILKSFNISPIVLLPAMIILLLSAFKIDVKISMSLSIISAILIALTIQHLSPLEVAKYLAIGYSLNTDGVFPAIIQGGGMYSMLKVCLIVIISSAYAGIFDGTTLLSQLECFCEKLSKKFGVYTSTILSSIACAVISCNQTLGVMLTNQLQQKIYQKNKLNNYRLALDLENTIILIAALVPWNIAASVPMDALDVGWGFLPYGFYLFLVPLANFFTRNMFKIHTK